MADVVADAEVVKLAQWLTSVRTSPDEKQLVYETHVLEPTRLQLTKTFCSLASAESQSVPSVLQLGKIKARIVRATAEQCRGKVFIRHKFSCMFHAASTDALQLLTDDHLVGE